MLSDRIGRYSELLVSVSIDIQNFWYRIDIGRYSELLVSVSVDIQNCWYRIGTEKWYRAIPTLDNSHVCVKYSLISLFLWHISERYSETGESAPFVFFILQKHKVLWILRVHTNESKCIALICTIKNEETF